MTTRIRLVLDLGVQLFFLFFLAYQLLQNPLDPWSSLALFSLGISSWQLFHAWYTVRKYRDWHRALYLKYMKQVVAYALITLGIGIFMLVSSFGFLWPFLVLVGHLLYWALCLVVPALALYAFGISVQHWYNLYRKPRSFWDL